MTFSNSYMITNRTETDTPELFGDTPQPNGAFTYAMASGAYVSDGGSFQTTSANDFYSALNDDLATLSSAQLTVFIHGLDTDWNGAVSYTSLIGGNLNGQNSGFDASYPGLVIGFSWPSTTSVVDYLTDRANIRATAAPFVTFVKDLQAHLPAGTTVSVVCHSEGNYMMKEAADALSAAGVSGYFDQILLVAADLPEDAFASNGYAAAIPDAADQVTVYFSNFDSTLAKADLVMALLDLLGEEANSILFPSDYTNWWPTWQRLGTFGVTDVTQTPENLYNINSSLVDNDSNVPASYSTHTAYFVIPQIVSDMGQTLSGVAPADISDRVTVPFTDEREFVMWPQDDAEITSQSGPFQSLLAKAGGIKALKKRISA